MDRWTGGEVSKKVPKITLLPQNVGQQIIASAVDVKTSSSSLFSKNILVKPKFKTTFQDLTFIKHLILSILSRFSFSSSFSGYKEVCPHLLK